jgi:formylglycine-generating enzyme required for sulfatase activity
MRPLSSCPSPSRHNGADCRAEFYAEREPLLPITCVDLCDAMAYCGWRGRRLCGGPGGVKLGPRRVDTPADEWLMACSGAGTRAFPYGKIYEPACNIDSSALVAVDARPRCTTPDGIAQLNGNAAEWVLSCRRRSGVEECLTRGGEFRSADLSTAGCYLPHAGIDIAVPSMAAKPLERSPGVGIRCCAD